MLEVGCQVRMEFLLMYFSGGLHPACWPAESIEKVSDCFLQMYLAINRLKPCTDNDGIVINPCQYVFDVASTRKTDTCYMRAVFVPGRVRVCNLSNVDTARFEQQFQHLSLVGNWYPRLQLKRQGRVIFCIDGRVANRLSRIIELPNTR